MYSSREYRVYIELVSSRGLCVLKKYIYRESDYFSTFTCRVFFAMDRKEPKVLVNGTVWSYARVIGSTGDVYVRVEGQVRGMLGIWVEEEGREVGGLYTTPL